MKPTYGGVSRYGLVALANSLDQAGPVTRTVLDAAMLHDVIGGHDPRDSTSIDQRWPPFTEAARQGAAGDMSGVKVGVITELAGDGWQAGVMARFRSRSSCSSTAGAEVVEVSCPPFVHALATYYLILPAEASRNLAKFDAMRYGLRVLPEGIDDPSAEDVMRATRDAGFGDEVKRRIILGTYALSSGYYDAYYGQAQKVRTLISRDFDAAFEQVDVLVSPTAPTTAFKLGEKLDDPMAMYLNDLATIPANLAGVPGISVPSGLADEDGLPAGFQVLAPALADDRRLPRRRRARGPARRAVGRPPARPGPGPGRARPHERRMTDAVPFDDVLPRYDPALGLEVHVELNTATKMFCGCPAVFGGEPNTAPARPAWACPARCRWSTARRWSPRSGSASRSTARSPSGAGSPGRTTSTRTCRRTSRPRSTTSRSASTAAWTSRSTARRYRVEIERAHMEEDTGKSLHVGGTTGRIHGADYSLVDYNRAGIPLIEIVTRPILGAGEKAPEVARAYVAQLRELIVALGVSEARMDQGNLRADVNLSLAPKGTGTLGTRTETKNVNSFRSVERAVRYEMQRHAVILSGGGSILQETRHWHEDTGITTSGREKSDAEDYRYFPEPDLVPVAPSREWVEELRGDAAGEPDRASAPGCRPTGASATWRCATPSAPARSAWSRRPSRPGPPRRPRASGGSASSPAAATRTASTSSTCRSPRPTWPASRRSSTRRSSTTSSPARSSRASSPARAPRTRSWRSAGWPWCPTTARSVAAVDSAIAANPDVADKIRDGKVAAAGALIGAVMKEMRGQADAGRVRELILEKLS